LLVFAHDQDLWGQNALDHHTFDQNLEAAMLYVRYCRQYLKPTPPLSPVAEPSQALIAVYDKYPNLDASAHFNPKVFRDHLDGVFEQFGRHMVEEIKTLSKENIEKIGEKNLERINVGLKKVLMDHEPEWFLCSNCCEYSDYVSAGEILTGSCLPSQDPSSIARFAVDRQVDITSRKYPTSSVTSCTGLMSKVGMGPEACGLVAILPLSRGTVLSFRLVRAHVTESDFLWKGLMGVDFVPRMNALLSL
jgi:hypothetical protein